MGFQWRWCRLCCLRKPSVATTPPSGTKIYSAHSTRRRTTPRNLWRSHSWCRTLGRRYLPLFPLVASTPWSFLIWMTSSVCWERPSCSVSITTHLCWRWSTDDFNADDNIRPGYSMASKLWKTLLVAEADSSKKPVISSEITVLFNVVEFVLWKLSQSSWFIVTLSYLLITTLYI